MPRVTRAALRANSALDDVAASVPLPVSPYGGGGRRVLGEISTNQEDHNASLDTTAATATKKPAVKTKKGKGSKKTKKRHADLDENCQVLEDENQSGSSSAVEDACEELLKRSDNGGMV